MTRNWVTCKWGTLKVLVTRIWNKVKSSFGTALKLLNEYLIYFKKSASASSRKHQMMDDAVGGPGEPQGP